MRMRYVIWMSDTPVVSEYNGTRIDDPPKPKGAHPMKSKVFSIDFVRHPGYSKVWVYRTNGRVDGGGLRMYRLTPDRVIQLLRVLYRVSCQHRCMVQMGDEVSTWTICGVVEQMQTAQAALAGSS